MRWTCFPAAALTMEFPETTPTRISSTPIATMTAHRFTLSTTYNVPGIKSPLQMLQGWSISPIIAIYSATPWSADDLTNDITGTGALNNASTPFQFWNFSGP